MKTSNFKQYKGDSGVAICIYPPFNWTGPIANELAPDKETFFLKKADKINEEEYEKRYIKNTLSKLNPREIYEKYKDKVVLCWEPSGKFCHRRILAKWIYESISINVPEWNIKDDIPNDIAKTLF
jgi:uncharacterized protein (DUF488 family)